MDLQSPFRVLLSCGDLTVNVGGTLLRAPGGHCNLVGVVSFPLILCSVIVLCTVKRLLRQGKVRQHILLRAVKSDKVSHGHTIGNTACRERWDI